MKYCSECGSANIRFTIPPGDNRNRWLCGDCEVIHYINPRIIAGVLATWEGKVLLCRRSIEPQKDLWNLPAGFLENGETVEEGAIREAWEESLIQAGITRLHCVYSVPSVNQVFLIFHADMTGPEFSVTAESSEVQLFEEAEIPWDEIAFTSSRFALEKYFRNREFEGVHIGSFYPEEHKNRNF